MCNLEMKRVQCSTKLRRSLYKKTTQITIPFFAINFEWCSLFAFHGLRKGWVFLVNAFYFDSYLSSFFLWHKVNITNCCFDVFNPTFNPWMVKFISKSRLRSSALKWKHIIHGIHFWFLFQIFKFLSRFFTSYFIQLNLSKADNGQLLLHQENVFH